MSYRNNFMLIAAAVALFSPAIIPSASHAAVLSGSYGFSRMAAGFPGSTENMALAGSGSIVFNSDGNCSARFDDTELRLDLTSGNVESSSGSQLRSCSYSAGSNGDLAITFPDNNVTYQGSVNADGSSLNLAGAESTAAGKVQMLLGHKLGSGMTAAALSGSYPVAWTGFGFPGATASRANAGRGAIIFDGKGGCRAELLAPGSQLDRSTGEVLQYELKLDYDQCGYNITSEGTAAVTLSRAEEEFTLQGSVSTDGSSFSLAGASGTEPTAIFMTGNKGAHNATVPYLRGSYGITRINLGFPGGTESRVVAGLGAITFNGMGRCNASFIDAEYAQALGSGAVADYSDAENISCSYSAGPEGVTLSFDNSSIPYRGHLSADGTSLTLTSLEETQNTVMLLAGIRLAVRYPSADLAGNWMSGGIRTPTSNNSDPNNFGYDVVRMILYTNGSGVNESISTSDPAQVAGPEWLPEGAITVHDDAALNDTNRTEYFYMNAGKNVMFQFHKAPEAGVQQFFMSMKQTVGYTGADVAGTWLGAGIKTPVKFNSDENNFGYDVEKLVLNADGSGSNWLRSSSTPSPAGMAGADEIFPAGYFSILPDGNVANPSLDHYFALNATKDVMFRLRLDPVNGAQQLFVNVKQGSNYALQDIVGKWVGVAVKTPLKGSTTANFGYEVAKLVVDSNGKGTATRVSSSNPIDLYILNIYNSFKVASDGTITTTTSDPANEAFFLNASKDVLVQFKKSATDQQLFVYLKEAPLPVFPLNGSCGSANGASLAEAPATNLCSSGTASLVTGTGPWNWSCSGANGGTAAGCSASANVSSWTLTVTVTGNGSVNSSASQSGENGINCTSDSATGCTATFTAGEQVQLFASPSAGSLFTSWSGSITGGADSVPIVMDGDKAITAIFNAAPKVMAGSKGFATLQAAYDDADTVNGSVIRLLEGFLPGSFTAWRGIGVTVEGGYDETFGSRNSSTSVPAPFKVKGGQVRVLGVKVTAQQ